MQILVLFGELSLLPCTLDEYIDLRHAIRLRHIVVSSELHRRDRCLDRAVARDDDDLGRVWLLAHLPKYLEPIHLGHHDVKQGHVERLGAQGLERRTPVRHGRHLMSAAGEKAR